MPVETTEDLISSGSEGESAENATSDKPLFYPGNYRVNMKSGLNESKVPDTNSHYFRLAGSLLYYTFDKESTTVLGAIHIRNIKSTQDINDVEFDNWNVCANSDEEKKDWVCQIKETLGDPCEKNETVKEKTVESHIKQPIYLLPAAANKCEMETWNYLRQGSDWRCTCVDGQQQSPVNICKDASVIQLENGAKIEYFSQPVEDFKFEERNGFFQITSISRNSPLAFVTDSDDSKYECKEVHIHTPSEHTVSGLRAAMEIQVICYPFENADLSSKLAISFLAEESLGARNKFFDCLDFLKFPISSGSEVPLKEMFVAITEDKNDFMLSLQDLFFDVLPDREENEYKNTKFDSDSNSYFYYNGSLTFPPCDENVRWIVFRDNLNVGMTLMESMREMPADNEVCSEMN